MTKSFKEYITEMPHLIVGSDVIDLELEVRSNLTPKAFLQFFKDLFAGKSIPSKHQSELIQVNRANSAALAQDLLSNSFLQLFTKKHYGSKTLTDLNTLLRQYAR